MAFFHVTLTFNNSATYISSLARDRINSPGETLLLIRTSVMDFNIDMNDDWEDISGPQIQKAFEYVSI